MREIQWDNLRKVLERYADAWIKNAEANLMENDSNASGQLQRSMKLDKIVIDEKQMKVTIELEDYWWYVEHGTSPNYGAKKPERKMPPIKPIIEWIENKPVPPKVEGLTVKQQAYAIARGIGKNGTQPRPFFKKAVEQTWKQFKDEIAEAVQTDVNDYIEKIVLDGVEKMMGGK